MKEQFKKTPALAVNKNGDLTKVGEQIDINSINELMEIDFTPDNGWLILQPLPTKDVKTASGIIIPGMIADKHEFKLAIVAAPSDSKYKRGQVINLDQTMLSKELAEVYYICGRPLMKVPSHFVIGTYNNIDLSEWKAEKN